MKGIISFIAAFVLSYPLPAWKVISLALHKLPGARNFTVTYTRSDGVPCAFRLRNMKYASFTCNDGTVWKTSFSESVTIYTTSCTGAFVSFMSVMAAFKDEKKLEGIFLAVGVDTHTSSVARWQGDVAVVLGGGSPDAPQVWYHQETHLPVYVKLNVDDGKNLELKFNRYSPVKGLRVYPSDIEYWCGTEERMRFR